MEFLNMQFDGVTWDIIIQLIIPIFTFVIALYAILVLSFVLIDQRKKIYETFDRQFKRHSWPYSSRFNNKWYQPSTKRQKQREQHRIQFRELVESANEASIYSVGSDIVDIHTNTSPISFNPNAYPTSATYGTSRHSTK